MRLIEKRKIKLEELPKGRFFKYGDTIGVKSEYRTEGGAIEAFIIGSGEMFWGGTSKPLEQRKLEVIELELKDIDISNIKKILLDRENHLKSDISRLKNKKLDKRIDTLLINNIKSKLDELEWIKNKLNI